MSVDALLGRYLNGDFEINMNNLSNEDKVKYVQMTNLIDEFKRLFSNIDSIFNILHKSKEGD